MCTSIVPCGGLAAFWGNSRFNVWSDLWSWDGTQDFIHPCCALPLSHTSALWNYQIVFFTEPMLSLHAEWYRHEGKVCEKIVLFSHLCGEAVWELEPEPPAWAAQVLCREQGWRKVFLLSKASAHTLSPPPPFPRPSELLVIWIQIISWGWSREWCSQHWAFRVTTAALCP